jgi:hypothetical protein
MQTEWHGFYLDGRTAARHPVTVYLTPYGAEIRGHDGARHLWRYGEMRRAQGAFRHEPIRLERGSPLPEAIVVDDAEFGEALTRFMPDAPSPIFDARLHRRLPWIVAATLAAVAALAAIAMWGIPLLAEAAAPLVPAVWEHALGQAVFARLTAGEQRCTDPELTSALQAIVRRLSAARPDAGYSFELAVVESPDYNAFAAPAGYIVILRPLVDATASPEELAGVLAHEMQHVYQRHATKALLRDASIGMMVGALLGDVGGIGAIAVQAGRHADRVAL